VERHGGRRRALPGLLRQAFRVATSGAPGPVHLQFRGNEDSSTRRKRTWSRSSSRSSPRVPAFRPQADPNDVKKALHYLQQADRPVIIAGGGARWSGAGPELVALAEALSIPVATSLNGKDCIAASHPLAVGVVGSYRAKARTASSPRPTWCSSSAPRPAG